MQIKVNRLPQSIVEIEGELESEIFEGYFKKALEKLGQNVKIDGFRQGKVPENILLSNIPEISILEEMAEMALADNYEKILKDEKIDAISRPEIAITKLARNNPLGFKIKTTILPEVKLPEYKKIAKEINDKEKADKKETVVTDEEIENTIMDIRKSRAPKIHMSEPHEHKEGDEPHEHPEPELPEFNDDFVKGLGPFENVEDFKTKLKDNMKLEKENQAREKTRLRIIEEIIGGSKIDLPEVLVEMELNNILYKMESDISQMGLKFDEYLKHINKTVEDLKKDFRADAEKKAKLSLILHEISKEENIKAEPEQIANEVAHLLEHYKDADPERARMHAENVLTNEKIFSFLESQ
jgi:trigger factor